MVPTGVTLYFLARNTFDVPRNVEEVSFASARVLTASS
jgi:hypothetical protein